jgi:NAD(P)-dependent dehydrogenase (short-subunit alcohol dehydrogenase family)
MTTEPTILITGCSSGIGWHCAHALAGRGWRVFATARQQGDVERLAESGLEALQLDLDDSVSIAAAVDEVLARCDGCLDALFNNGGFGLGGAVEDMSRAALRAQLETNVLGWLELTNRVLPAMRAQGHGRIVQNSSLLGYVALRWRGAYNASKFALEGLTDTLRLELAGSGIQVVLIQPGPIASRFRANAVAAAERWIDAAASPHREAYEHMRARRERNASSTPVELGPEAVEHRLVQALEHPRPKPRYRVTFPAHLFAVLKRLLSTRALDRVLARVSE